MSDGLRSLWFRITVGLSVVLLALLVAVGVLAATRENGLRELETAAMPWQEPGNELTERTRAVAEAARAETLAFLAVDYRDMDPLMDRVLEGATGEFEDQYEERREDLKKQAQEAKSISTGEVVALGVGELDDDSAQVYVAANSEVQNTSTDGTAQPRYYRLRLDLQLVDEDWLVSQVQFVG